MSIFLSLVEAYIFLYLILVLQKKIQSAFSLKKKPSRKQEYKQLAAQYGKFDTESSVHGDEAIPLELSLSKNIKSNKLADSIESEWELL